MLPHSKYESRQNDSSDQIDINFQSHRLTTYSLRELIPDSLVVLQLRRCPKDNGRVRDQILELLSSKHPNLRRIEIDYEIDQELQNLAYQAGIDLYAMTSAFTCWRHPTACDCGRMTLPHRPEESIRYKCRVRVLGPTARYGILMPPLMEIGDLPERTSSLRETP